MKSSKSKKTESNILRYSLGKVPGGYALVARNSGGLCAVHLGSSPKRLCADLKSSFGDMECKKSDSALRADLKKVQKSFASNSAEQNGINKDIAMSGTPFEQRVWKELCRIPFGSTRSYKEIATRIGAPKASRAVAKACAANEIAVLIPCHRVIRSDGNLSGYRWGIPFKRKLLEIENVECS